jgi:hypothetical protein
MYMVFKPKKDLLVEHSQRFKSINNLNN